MGEFPMSDERLAELEKTLSGRHPFRLRLDEDEQHELMAEIRRLREPVDRKALDHMAAERDAAFARVAELEREVERLRARHDSRCLSLTDSDSNVYCDCRTWAAIDGGKATAEGLIPDRDRARSIAVALEGELAQIQAASRTVLDDRDRLQDRLLAVQAELDRMSAKRTDGIRLDTDAVIGMIRRALDGGA